MERAAHASQHLCGGELGLPDHRDTGGPEQFTKLGQEEAPSVKDENLTVRRECLSEYQEQAAANPTDLCIDLRLVRRVVCPVGIVSSSLPVHPHVLIVLTEHIAKVVVALCYRVPPDGSATILK